MKHGWYIDDLEENILPHPVSWPAIWGFVVDWSYSRRRSAMFFFLATLLAAGAIVCLTVQVAYRPSHELLERYRRHAKAAQAAGDHDRAELLFEKALMLDEKDGSSCYGLGLISAKRKDLAGATRWMIRAVEKDHYLPAAIWLANEELAKFPRESSRATLEQVSEQLLASLGNGSDDWAAWRLLGYLAVAQGDINKAVGYLLKVTSRFPEDKLTLAKLYAAQGQAAQAKRFADESLAFFRHRVEQEPGDHSARQKTAEASVLLGNWQHAEQVLREGLGGSDDALLLMGLAELYCSLSDALGHSSPGSLELQIEALGRAQEAVPNHRGSLTRLSAMLRGNVRLPDKQLPTVVRFMESLAQQNPQNVDLQIGLAQAALQQGAVEEAITRLSPWAAAEPAAALVLARAYAAKGCEPERDALLRSTFVSLHKQCENTPDDLQKRLLWMETGILLERWTEVESTLKAALESEAHPVWRAALVELYVTWSRRLLHEDAPTSLDLLRRALEIVPGDPSASAALLQLVRRESTTRELVRDLMKRLLADGKAPVVCHHVLGMLDLLDEHWEQAAFHLEQAIQDHSDDPALLNNVAWALGHLVHDARALERAAEFANRAVQNSPGSIEALETRGWIAVKRGEWAAGIKDIEVVLAQDPDRFRLHEILAEAYEGLGDSSMAARHREQVPAPVNVIDHVNPE